MAVALIILKQIGKAVGRGVKAAADATAGIEQKGTETTAKTPAQGDREKKAQAVATEAERRARDAKAALSKKNAATAKAGAELAKRKAAQFPDSHQDN